MASLCRQLVPLVRNFNKISLGVSAPIARFTHNYTFHNNGATLCRTFSSTMPYARKETVTLTFVLADGSKRTAQAKIGDNLLDVIVENDLDVDGFGACEGTLACSTCHLIFKQADYDKLPETPTDEELDMLDLAYSLTDTSRLGCQVIVAKEMENWDIKVPQGVADARDV